MNMITEIVTVCGLSVFLASALMAISMIRARMRRAVRSHCADTPAQQAVGEGGSKS